MQSFVAVALLAATAFASPVPAPIPQTLLPGATASDVQNGVCKPVTLIYARGSTEGGNLGAIVGPELENSLKSVMGQNNVATQGVNYDADLIGAVTGEIDPAGAAGAKNMQMFVQKATQACPSTQLVLAGYSQGAEELHGALDNLGQTGTSSIKSAVTFGDPLGPNAQFANMDASKTKVFCATGDGVCTGTLAVSAAHLSYGSDANAAAQFIQTSLGSNSTAKNGSTLIAQKASEDSNTKSSAAMKHTLSMDVWATLFACFIAAVYWI